MVNQLPHRPKARAFKRDRTTGATSLTPPACSVPLVDIADVAKKQFSKMRDDVDDLKTLVTPLEKLFTLLFPLSYFLEPTPNPSQSTLVSASKFVDSIVTEVTRRISCSNNAVVFNVPDRIPLQSVKSLMLQACGMAHTQCHCIRLRKRTQRYNCPLLFQFTNPQLADEFIRNRHLIAVRTNL